MKKILWHETQLASYNDFIDIHGLVEEYFQSVFAKFVLKSLQIISGMSVVENTTPSGQVLFLAGRAVGDGGNLILVEDPQLCNILDGSPGVPPPPWGSGQGAPSGSLKRNDIVAIRFAQYDDDNLATWFRDGTGTEYQSNVDRRTYDYFEIVVIHGTPATTPVDPATPADCIPVARVVVTSSHLTDPIRNADIQIITKAHASIGDTILDYIENHKHKGVANDFSAQVSWNDLIDKPGLGKKHIDLDDMGGSTGTDRATVDSHDPRYDARYGVGSDSAPWAGIVTLRRLFEVLSSNSNGGIAAEGDVKYGAKIIIPHNDQTTGKQVSLVTPPPANEFFHISQAGADWVEAGKASGFGDKHWKLPVATVPDLPTVGNENGDVRLVFSNNSLYRWDAGLSIWTKISGGGGVGLGALPYGDYAFMSACTGSTANWNGHGWTHAHYDFAAVNKIGASEISFPIWSGTTPPLDYNQSFGVNDTILELDLGSDLWIDRLYTQLVLPGSCSPSTPNYPTITLKLQAQKDGSATWDDLLDPITVAITALVGPVTIDKRFYELKPPYNSLPNTTNYFRKFRVFFLSYFTGIAGLFYGVSGYGVINLQLYGKPKIVIP